MIGGLTVTDLLLIQVAANGELHSRLSRGYDEDDKPEGWPVLIYREQVAATDDVGRLEDLQRHGYLTWDDEGPVTVTDAGREAIS